MKALLDSDALTHLEFLDLSNCRLGNKRAASLASLLLEHPRLRSLELGHNEIGGKRYAAEVATSFGALMRANGALE